MTTLYNCRHSSDQYRITKFDHNFDVESSYLCTATECECPAGHRHTCRHREMLPKFLQRDHVGDEWFFDYDRGGWVQGVGISMERAEATVTDPEEELAFEEENDEVEVEPALELSYRPDAPAEGTEPSLPSQPMPTTTSPQPALVAGPPTIRRRV